MQQGPKALREGTLNNLLSGRGSPVSKAIRAILSGYQVDGGGNNKRLSDLEYKNIATALAQEISLEELIEEIQFMDSDVQVAAINNKEERANFHQNVLVLLSAMMKADIKGDNFAPLRQYLTGEMPENANPQVRTFMRLLSFRNSASREILTQAAIESRGIIQARTATEEKTPIVRNNIQAYVTSTLKTKKVDRKEMRSYAKAAADDLKQQFLAKLEQIKTKESNPASFAEATKLFNRIPNLFINDILSSGTKEHQQKIALFYAMMADEAMKNHDYYTGSAILAAFNINHMNRLEYLKEGKVGEILGKYANTFDNQFNFKTYKEMIAKDKESGTHYVPYFPQLQGELTFIKEGNPSHIETPNGKMRNIHALQLAGSTISGLQESIKINLQDVQNKAPTTDMVSRIDAAPTVDEDIAYQTSSNMFPGKPFENRLDRRSPNEPPFFRLKVAQEINKLLGDKGKLSAESKIPPEMIANAITKISKEFAKGAIDDATKQQVTGFFSERTINEFNEQYFPQDIRKPAVGMKADAPIIKAAPVVSAEEHDPLAAAAAKAAPMMEPISETSSDFIEKASSDPSAEEAVAPIVAPPVVAPAADAAANVAPAPEVVENAAPAIKIEPRAPAAQASPVIEPIEPKVPKPPTTPSPRAKQSVEPLSKSPMTDVYDDTYKGVKAITEFGENEGAFRDSFIKNNAIDKAQDILLREAKKYPRNKIPEEIIDMGEMLNTAKQLARLSEKVEEKLGALKKDPLALNEKNHGELNLALKEYADKLARFSVLFSAYTAMSKDPKLKDVLAQIKPFANRDNLMPGVQRGMRLPMMMDEIAKRCPESSPAKQQWQSLAQMTRAISGKAEQDHDAKMVNYEQKKAATASPVAASPVSAFASKLEAKKEASAKTDKKEVKIEQKKEKERVAGPRDGATTTQPPSQRLFTVQFTVHSDAAKSKLPQGVPSSDLAVAASQKPKPGK